MDIAIKINKEHVERIDEQRAKYSLGTRQNLTNTLIRKALDYLEETDYVDLINLGRRGK